MPDSETAAVLRTILEELCTELSLADAHVASKLPDAAEPRRCSLDDLKEFGRQTLHKTPTMWP